MTESTTTENCQNKRPRKVIISAHGDTNWQSHHLEHRLRSRDTENDNIHNNNDKDSNNNNDELEIEYYGHMDNFGGVYAVMQAYFSGKLTVGPSKGKVQVEITYGEETDMKGAKEVARKVQPNDVVIVVDVTGAITNKNFVIEKCFQKRMKKFITKILREATSIKDWGKSGIISTLTSISSFGQRSDYDNNDKSDYNLQILLIVFFFRIRFHL
eukprot:TRINITY_DN11545_c0_g1_i1.p1 TRINITY_DN11545_c0_g1~~TRINITY_DN11545_c0_g1_i1.p1  ORF type:complete len:213 (-),score=32.26 TRINITY_DN11545_c0_g1_i1:231-869(-)